ncbi:hypothetical protein DACRYDRAFT_23351 [Dacryopinax primogenitus]|uniref:Protein CPL1-like domain-containing protein n=1 Tax=Dacryopinax primogenitus (strain DJM 731) TaxID=1858805 RepID=M5G9I9_DACPD|nr:uncharacterized protein DACRYDRAFT_23351 [Dacryopinax primogenitus]EJU00473.1 hypothetical protein DACRYDRAFT_23351 [Dacryopinax primogenitus]
MIFARLSALLLAVSGAFAATIGLRDTCAEVDSDLILDVDLVAVDFGHIGPICLCLSGIPGKVSKRFQRIPSLILVVDLITSDTLLSVPVQLLGALAVEEALTALVGSSPICNSSPSTRKRDTYTFNDRMCPKGLSLCGIQSSWSNTNWECIDTRSDLESCGGCLVGVMGTSGTGVDCTAIEGVEDVACNEAKCQVFSCASGYRVSDCGTSCVRTAPHT